MSEFTIRPANLQDTEAIHSLLMELAVYEKIDHLVEATVNSTHKALFGAIPVADALVAELNGALVATAVHFQNYSTFMGCPGLYLEDIYVQPTHRGNGIGRSLIIELAKIARSRGCGRMEWSVLGWNTRAIDFYERLGAQILPDWHIVRLTHAGIDDLAGQ